MQPTSDENKHELDLDALQKDAEMNSVVCSDDMLALIERTRVASAALEACLEARFLNVYDPHNYTLRPETKALVLLEWRTDAIREARRRLDLPEVPS